MTVRKAPVCALAEQRAGAWPDVLTLVTFTTGALSDEKAAVLAKIITPWIRIVARRRLVEDKGPSVHLAGVRLIFAVRVADGTPGKIAITPIIE